MGAQRALALGLALVALWPAAAHAGSESVTSGAVTAKLT